MQIVNFNFVSTNLNNLHYLQVIATYSFTESTKETVLNMLSQTSQYHLELPLDVQNGNIQEGSENVIKHSEIHQLEDAWRMLYSDCLSALQVCVEGELKHFHKARYRLAQGLHKRGDRGDLEKAKDELSFCFKSSRSTFTINMWEIDGTVRKGRYENFYLFQLLDMHLAINHLSGFSRCCSSTFYAL